MRNLPNFITEKSTKEYVLIRDVGPWDQYLSVTNGAEQVVDRMVNVLGLDGRDLYYYDSDGSVSQLLVDTNGSFAGFSPNVPEGY